jgi:hypothetical protein
MGVHHRLTPVVVMAIALASVAGSMACKRKRTDDSAPPPDHLATGELPLGPDKAYSLPLPRGARIATQYATEVQVFTGFSPEVLSNFVRFHVRGGKVVVGTSSTQFDDVYVTEDPKRLLFIEVRPADVGRVGSQMIVRDRTGGDPKLPPDEHFRRLGLTPDGKLADPKLMQ